MYDEVCNAFQVRREKIEEQFKREVYGLLNPQTDLDRIIDDVVDYVARNNRSLLGFGAGTH